MIINLEQSERHLFMLSYRVMVFPRIQGGVPVFFHLRYIYVGLGSGLWRGAFDEFSLQLAIAVIQ